MKIIILTKGNFNEAIDTAVDFLKQGKIVVYPTETCYGIGVDVSNQDAIKRLLEYKERPEGKPILIAVKDKKMAEDYVEINEKASNLYDQLLPGPVTIVSKSKGKVSKGIEAENGSLGIRIPDHEVPINIVRKIGVPITTTSANVSGKPHPYKIDDIFKYIPKYKKKYIDLILDAGELPHNPPSTIIDTTKAEMDLVRKGSVRFFNKVMEYNSKSTEDTIKIASELIFEIIGEVQNSEPPQRDAKIFLLNGHLGAGKTQFVKGIAKGLGIDANIKSPTYTFSMEHDIPEGVQNSEPIHNRNYRRKRKLIHIDLWKVENKETFDMLRIEDYLVEGNVVAIEWADKFVDYFIELSKGSGHKPEPALKIFDVRIEFVSEEERQINIYSN